MIKTSINEKGEAVITFIREPAFSSVCPEDKFNKLKKENADLRQLHSDAAEALEIANKRVRGLINILPPGYSDLADKYEGLLKKHQKLQSDLFDARESEFMVRTAYAELESKNKNLSTELSVKIKQNLELKQDVLDIAMEGNGALREIESLGSEHKKLKEKNASLKKTIETYTDYRKEDFKVFVDGTKNHLNPSGRSIKKVIDHLHSVPIDSMQAADSIKFAISELTDICSSLSAHVVQEIIGVDQIINFLEIKRKQCESGTITRHDYNEALDRLRILQSKINQSKKFDPISGKYKYDKITWSDLII